MGTNEMDGPILARKSLAVDLGVQGSGWMFIGKSPMPSTAKVAEETGFMSRFARSEA